MPQDEGDASARTLSITMAGVIGTILIAALVIVFARLGFWQLARLQERRALNTDVAARLHMPPLTDAALLADTAGLYYRAITLAGAFDNDRSIVLPGRSHRGLPGVYLLTPLRVHGRSDAVLVNRGWVPSADASTVDLADLQLPDTATILGLIVPFPGGRESLAPRDPVERGGEFRRVWFTVDEAALRAQFPYPLMPPMLQALPVAAPAQRYPARLEPPPLDEGSHLGYALQWFSFAVIGIIGWCALVLRRGPRVRPPLVTALLLLAAASPARAQLRPLDPIEWRIFDADRRAIGEVGSGMLFDLTAPLAGARGRLLELGNYSVALRSDRIAMEVRGPAVWRFTESQQTATSAQGVHPAQQGIRQDAGIATASTSFRVSPTRWRTDVMVRFGATIPTTSDESGLDRDRTDFFATVALRYPRGTWSLWMENGLGINGTTSNEYPQSDVWTYAFGATRHVSVVNATISLVGRQDGHSWIVRENEDQRELRIGADVGRTRWLSVR